ncbi:MULTISPECIES: LysE family translocator [Bhargavaea]|uniref:LysE family translocator n=1 Tax=Bhargavaea changchunensis TaxID=2134037 RepID=A0ABW2NLE0_9BACL|nr:LysE family translocator [Bhargavaea sp. CC-171006]
MDLVLILSFLGAAVVLTLMPGPDNLFTLAQSIASGKLAGIWTTLGLCTGLLVHIAAAVIGLSALIYQSAFAFSVVKYAGAAYLLYLAYQSFKAKDTTLKLESGTALDYSSLYKKGLIMNLLNPKVSLFFLALLPQFIASGSGNVQLQMLTLGLVFLIQAFVIFSLISLFAGKVGVLIRKNPSLSRRMNLIQGGLFTLIGLRLALGGK